MDELLDPSLVSVSPSMVHEFEYGGCMNEPYLVDGWVPVVVPHALQRRDLNIVAGRLLPPPPTVWMIGGRVAAGLGSSVEGVLKPT